MDSVYTVPVALGWTGTTIWKLLPLPTGLGICHFIKSRISISRGPGIIGSIQRPNRIRAACRLQGQEPSGGDKDRAGIHFTQVQ